MNTFLQLSALIACPLYSIHCSYLSSRSLASPRAPVNVSNERVTVFYAAPNGRTCSRFPNEVKNRSSDSRPQAPTECEFRTLRNVSLNSYFWSPVADFTTFLGFVTEMELATPRAPILVTTFISVAYSVGRRFSGTYFCMEGSFSKSTCMIAVFTRNGKNTKKGERCPKDPVANSLFCKHHKELEKERIDKERTVNAARVKQEKVAQSINLVSFV